MNTFRGTFGGLELSPAPTVELFAVGFLSGAAGGGAWDVEVRGGSNEILGSVRFTATDDEAVLKRASITWPATATQLATLKLVKYGSPINPGGNLHLNKVFLRLSQTGTIAATRGQVPLLATQQITGSSWADVADPFLYQHRETGFDPVPSIHLRVAAEAPSCFPFGGSVRLVDAAGAVVSGTETTFCGGGSPPGPSYHRSAALSLVDGQTYRLQAKTSYPGWRIYSADLEFAQSTLDLHGLASIVGWYPSTTTPTHLGTNGQRTEHRMPPVINDAELARADWITVTKRLTGSGEVGADLVGSAGGDPLVGGITTTNGTYTVGVKRLTTPPPLGSGWWDTQALLEPGTTGRLSSSVLRVSLRLRDTITSLEASEPAFSPNGDGVKDSTVITGEINPDVAQPNWLLTIRDESNASVREFSGMGNSVGEEWFGDDHVAAIVPDGALTATLTLPGNSAAFRQVLLLVDTRKPRFASLLPEASGNTVFAQQRLGLKAIDDRSGIDATTTEINFNGQVGFSSQMLTMQEETGWATTPAVHLTPGTEYEAAAELRDLAGNLATESWRFRAITLPQPAPTAVSVFGAGVDAGPGISPGMRSWSFKPQVSIESRLVELPYGSQHPGFGTLVSSVQLGSAKVWIEEGSGGSEWGTPPFGSSDVREVVQQLPYVDPAGVDYVALVPDNTYELPAVTVDLPDSVSDARIVMEAESEARIGALCEDPSIEQNCYPDPLRFFISDRLAGELHQASLPEVDVTEETEPSIFIGVERLVADATDLEDGQSWKRIQPFIEYPCIPGVNPLSRPVCLLNEVYYPHADPAVPEEQQQEFCNRTGFCDPRDSNYRNYGEKDEHGNYLKWYCIRPDDGKDQAAVHAGGHNYGSLNEYCSQGVAMGITQPYGRNGRVGQVSGDRLHYFRVFWNADWGYAEGVGDDLGAYDELGLHWATSMPDMDWGFPLIGDLSGEPPRHLIYEPVIYPEISPDVPRQTAFNDYVNCFAIPGNHKIPAQLRTRGDPSTGGVFHGAGPRSETSAAGYTQYQRCGSTSTRLRTKSAELNVVVRQTDQCGQNCENKLNGYIHATWGHTEASFRPADFWWNFAAGMTANCVARTAQACFNPLGVLFVTADSAVASEGEDHITYFLERPRAFRYD